MGCALHAALANGPHPPILHWTRNEASAAEARREGFAVRSGALPSELALADLLLVAVADGAVNEVAAQLAGSALVRHDATCAHLSGSLGLNALAPLSAASHTGSLHLLVSLSTRRDPVAGAFAALEAGDETAAAMLDGLARSIGVRPFRLRGDRARYHAAACMVGNYPQVLVESALRLLSDSGLSRDEARELIAPLLQSAVRNALEKDGAASLSGPIVRGDASVVTSHLAAMGMDPALALTAEAYRSLGVIAASMSGHEKDSSVLRALDE